MNYDFWKKTMQVKPFKSVEEFERFTDDLVANKGSRGIVQSYGASRPTAKKGLAEGTKFDSFAEYCFYEYKTRIEGAYVERNLKSTFLLYTDTDGKQRKFYPDFTVNGKYAEVKGMFRQSDACKKDQHPEVEWYFSSDIKEMAKELDDKFPGWREKFVQTNVTKN